jgi:hypothetical protein
MGISNQFTNSFSADADVQIIVELISQSPSTNSSVVNVRGWMHNKTGSTVSNPTANTTRSITGEQSYTPSPFSFSVPAHGAFEFINHNFTVHHNSDGTKSVHFWIQYGDSHTSVFGSNRGANVVLDLTRIPKAPSVPGTPTLSSITPTGATLSWAAPVDNGGATITQYKIRVSNFLSGSVIYLTTSGARSIPVSFTPGVGYAYSVQAYNGAYGGGWSPLSGSVTINAQAGAFIRVTFTDGTTGWVLAVPYIRVGGVWKTASPYIRKSGVWKTTE